MNLWYYAKREIAGPPMHSVLNALTVAIGVAMIITLFSVSMAYEKAVTSPFTSVATDIALSRVRDETSQTPAAKGVILPSANRAIDFGEINRLAALPEVKEAAAALLLWSFDPGRFKVIVGIDPVSPAIGPSKAREWIKEGRFFEQGETGVAVLESHYAKFYGLKVGDHLTIAGHQFPVVGLYEVREGTQLTAANIYLPLADAQIPAGVDNDTINSIYLNIKDASRWRHVVGTFLSSRWQIDAFQLSETPPLPGMAAATSAAIRLPALFPASLYLGSLIGALAVGLFVALSVARNAAAIRPSESWRRL